MQTRIVVAIFAVLGVMVASGLVLYGHIVITPKTTESTLPVEPGATVAINVENYFNGKIEKHSIQQLSGSVVNVVSTDSGYTIEIPRRLRGEQLSFTISATSPLNQSQVTVHLVSDFIGQISDLAISLQALCLRDQYGVFCWGNDHEGQSSQVPEHLSGEASLFAGSQFFCGVESGRLTCWGSIKTDVALKQLTAIAAGGAGVCYVDRGIVQCHASGSALDLIRNQPGFPVSDRATISVGRLHACLLDTGTVHCWGDNRYKQIVAPLDLIYPTKIVAGDTFSCALDSGQLRCWGIGQFYTRMPQLGSIEDLRANGNRICAKSNASWYCWPVSSGMARHYQKSVYPATESVKIFQSTVCDIKQDEPDCDGLIHAFPHTVKRPHHLRQNGHSACFVDQGDIFCLGQKPDTMKRLTAMSRQGMVSQFDFDTRNGNACIHFENSLTECFGHRKGIERIRIDGEVTDLDLDNAVCVLSDKKARCISDAHDKVLSAVPAMTSPQKIRVSVNQGIRTETKSQFACVLDGSQLKCWGDNNAGQLDIPQLEKPVDFDLYNESGCIISNTQSACWGNPNYLPKSLPKSFTNASSISLMQQKYCVIDEGQALCSPMSDNKTMPSLLNNVVELETGISKNCAINASGVTCWGGQYFRYGAELPEENFQ